MKEKIILFYKYIFIEQPESIKKWQLALCERLGLKGRILLAHEGINATLGGTDEALEAYKNAMNTHELFGAIDFKESPGAANDFPRLKVLIKQEIVKLGIAPQELSAADAAEYLTPAQAHALIASQPDDLIMIDTRNQYETRIGTFVGAIDPKTDYFREFPAYVETNKNLFKDKQVLMFCTGGVRCERASALVEKLKVAKKVYHIKGGIHRYVEEFPNGFFRGKNYVFDARISMKINDDILTTCDFCPTPYDELENCLNAECNKQIVVCPSCKPTAHNCCSTTCKERVLTGSVTIRKSFKNTNAL